MEAQNNINREALIRGVPGLLDELRFKHDFTIQVDTRVKIQSLLLRLSARGHLPNQPEQLQHVIGPLLCSSPNEQRIFRQVFSNWADRIQAGPAESKSLSPITQDVHRMTWWSRAFILLAILCVLGLAIKLFWLPSSPLENPSTSQSGSMEKPFQGDLPSDTQTFSTQVTPDKPIEQRYPWWIFSSTILLFIMVWFFWMRCLADRHINRHYSNDDVTMIHTRVDDFQEPMFHSPAFLKILREYHVHRPIRSNVMNVAKTLEKSICHWPDFQAVYGQRFVRPQYLILIDKTSFQDHQATLISMIVSQLKEQDVYINVYYFDGDPRVCRSQDYPEEYVSLLQLASDHPEHRLLIFSDARQLLDPLTGVPFDWLQRFNYWQNRALLVPEPLLSDISQQLLQESDFLIVPASPDGMANLIQTLNDDAILHPKNQTKPMPDMLQTAWTQWCENHAPDKDKVDQLIDILRSYLDSSTFYWLCACAVYPHLIWRLTLFLGSRLKDGSQPLFNEKSVSILSSLPWFRLGYMPDWLRRKLLDALTDEQEKQVRQIILHLLFKLEAASEKEGHLTFYTSKFLISRLMSKYKSGANLHAPVHDRIYIEFLIRNRLSFRIKNQIYEKIQQIKNKDKQSDTKIVEQISRKTKTEPVLQMEFQWIEGGCFMMGQTEDEKKQIIDERGEKDYEAYYKRELPRHEVCVNGFWMAKYPVTVGQFRQFVQATGHQTDAEKAGESYTLKDKQWKTVKGVNWKNPGFEQDDNHPAVCLSWNDGVALAKWLSEKNEGTIRLPTEAEWEYASRAGTTTARFWGDDPSQACQYANVADQTAKKEINFTYTHDCDDGYVFTSPVGTFLPNPWGLYDMLGNVWEWTADAYDEKAYEKHKRDNPIMESEGASFRVLRGGSWVNGPADVRCATRFRGRPDVSSSGTGQRLLWTVNF
jgi:formylglycine-generating enzyme required for sulfatase activity